MDGSAAWQGGARYTSMGDCMRRTWQAQGVRGLYKGAASPLAFAMASNAQLFAFNGVAGR